VPESTDLTARTAKEVLEDHLALAAAGDWRTDLERNVADDIVVLGAFEGRDQIRVLAELLDAQLPDARFEYTTVLVRGEIGYLEWTADATGARVRDGADSFVIRDGRIVAQTIHHTIEPTD
jgi:ketosteroid isomerase-like protein